MKITLLLFMTVCAFLMIFAACNTDSNTNDSVCSSYTAEQSDTVNSSENSENNEDEIGVSIMYVTINSNKLKVELEQNSSVVALIEILEQNDITYTATDYGNFEKVGNIGYTLPRNDEQITTQAGDVILYQGCNICLYYGANTWSFTRIGRINGFSTEQLKELLYAGSGNVEVTLSLN